MVVQLLPGNDGGKTRSTAEFPWNSSITVGGPAQSAGWQAHVPPARLPRQQEVSAMRRPPLKARVQVAAVTALVALTAVAASAAVVVSFSPGPTSTGSGSKDGAGPSRSGSLPASAPGTQHPSDSVVNISLTDSGGPMGEGNGMMHPGAMALSAEPATVRHGTVTFRVSNAGTVTHELVILPLAASQAVGARPFGADATIDETGSLGEASKSGGEGPGEGILPGASSRVTVTLAPGQYELVCNLMGHYVSGMYSKLTVN